MQKKTHKAILLDETVHIQSVGIVIQLSHVDFKK